MGGCVWGLGLRVSDATRVEGFGWGAGVWAQHSTCAKAVARKNSLICAFSGSLPLQCSLERAGIQRLGSGGTGKMARTGERSKLAPAGDKSHGDETLMGCTSAHHSPVPTRSH